MSAGLSMAVTDNLTAQITAKYSKCRKEFLVDGMCNDGKQLAMGVIYNWNKVVPVRRNAASENHCANGITDCPIAPQADAPASSDDQ